MKLSSPLLFTLAGVMTQTQASPVSFAIDEAVMTTVGPITPGGPDITLVGTAKSTYEQILALNPDYNPLDFGGQPLSFDASATLAKKAHDTLYELMGRTATGGCCDCLPAPYNKATASTNYREGWEFLKAMGSRQCTTGPSGVSRLSCSNKAAIWMVSTSQRATYSTCDHVGNLAMVVVGRCAPGGFIQVTGQECDTGGFCVYLGSANC